MENQRTFLILNGFTNQIIISHYMRLPECILDIINAVESRFQFCD